MSTENDNAPAYPGLGYLAPSGLTKRELFAAMAMQGLVVDSKAALFECQELVAHAAVKCADALLAELAKPREEK